VRQQRNATTMTKTTFVAIGSFAHQNNRPMVRKTNAILVTIFILVLASSATVGLCGEV
jgi:hypothetical protein